MDNLLKIFTKNVVLTGFMGTGKTSVGRVLARKLNREVVDIDTLIEDRERRQIADIFDQEGEAYFRNLEKQIILDVSKKENIVITTGGGIVLDPENVEALRQRGWIISLRATPETIYRRVKNSRSRPLLLRSANMFREIKRLLAERKPLYEKADYVFDTDRKTPNQVASEILMTLEGHLS